MNRNIVKLVVFMLILVVAVAGCGQKDTEEKTEMTTIKDELGTEKIKKNPKRASDVYKRQTCYCIRI